MCWKFIARQLLATTQELFIISEIQLKLLLLFLLLVSMGIDVQTAGLYKMLDSGSDDDTVFFDLACKKCFIIYLLFLI